MVHNIINNKSVVFLKYPTEFPVAGEHLDVREEALVTDLKEGEVLLRNLYVSSDPYLRGRMRKDLGYVGSFEIGKPISSSGVSEVIESKNPAFPIGNIVSSETLWQEYSLISAAGTADLTNITDARDDPKIPLSYHIGVLGMPGLTAYSSLKIIGQPKKGETIYISAASGAVGQLVGQIARFQGLRVIGSAGSDEKVNYLLNDLKFDAAFNYKTGNILENLRKHAPNGIDIYYDNVGGETLEAAIEVLNLFGRVIGSGHISGYNGQEPYGVRNLAQIIGKRLTIRGFIVVDFGKEVGEEFKREVTKWIRNDEIIYKEDISKGIDAAPDAFIGMLKGKNFGKQVIQIADL
ncbi:hypothetical protein BGZ94_003869 [Podila epigama]|nr:hypothetical protein BGZ94_003869 [Podila epigama]